MYFTKCFPLRVNIRKQISEAIFNTFKNFSVFDSFMYGFDRGKVDLLGKKNH